MRRAPRSIDRWVAPGSGGRTPRRCRSLPSPSPTGSPIVLVVIEEVAHVGRPLAEHPLGPPLHVALPVRLGSRPIAGLEQLEQALLRPDATLASGGRAGIA